MEETEKLRPHLYVCVFSLEKTDKLYTVVHTYCSCFRNDFIENSLAGIF